MSDKSYKDQSRSLWQRADGQQPALEQLQFGAIQRIADACELMAEDHGRLVSDRDWYKDRADRSERREDALKRQLSAAKGQITKLRKKMAEMAPSTEE